jgi:hypothetical protein
MFGDKLCKIEPNKMQDILHKWQVAIVWQSDKSEGNKLATGSGLLISKNLVLTVAHNFYNLMHKRVDLNIVNLYPGQYG